MECFFDEAEVELFEVAQAAVDQFARAAGCARCPIALFDQRDGKSAACRIECRARSNDSAADHEEIEGLFLDGLEIGASLCRAELRWIHWAAPLIASRVGSPRQAHSSAQTSRDS